MGGKTRDPGKSARKSLKKARNYYRGLTDDLPSLEDLQVDLEAPELQGLLDEIALKEEEAIRIDPQLRQAQMEALAQMQEQGKGLTPEQIAARNEMMRGVEASAVARRKAVDQEMAQRGMASSGASLLAKMQANEAANQRAAEASDKLLAQADQARRDALTKSADMASGLETRDFQRDKGERSYRQEIDKFNLQNRQNTQRFNLANRQQLENIRTNTANQQAMRNAAAHQQLFQNRMGIASGMAGTRGQEAGTYAMRPEKQTSGLGMIAGGLIGMKAGPQGAVAGAQAGEMVEQKLAGEDGTIVKGYENGGAVQRFEDPKNVVQNNESFLGGLGNELSGMGSTFGDWLGFNKEEEKPTPENIMKDVDWDKQRKNATRIGVGNDKTSAEVQTDSDAKKLMKKDDDEKWGASDFKNLAGLLSDSNKQPAQQQMPSFRLDPVQVQNILPSNYSPAAYEAPQFEDGGLSEGEKRIKEMKRAVRARLQNSDNPMSGQEYIDSQLGKGENAIEEMKRKVRENLQKNYEDGGTYEYADGGLEFLSDGSGDIVEGDSYERDRVDAKLNSGEMVLNAAQQQRLLDLIRGEISPNEVGEEDIVEGVPQEYQEDLMEGEKDDKMAKGLKKLLNMLGE